jgi:hypothetical protein
VRVGKGFEGWGEGRGEGSGDERSRQRGIGGGRYGLPGGVEGRSRAVKWQKEMEKRRRWWVMSLWENRRQPMEVVVVLEVREV